MTGSIELPLSGKVAVLTGVSRRGQVGEVVARTLAARGASVVLIDRTGVEAEERAKELRTDGLSAKAFRADLTDATQLAAIAVSVAAEHGGVDALVNIAGGFGMSGKVSDSDPEAWSRQLSIGLTTAYLTTRAFLPLVRQRRGSIVFFASASALPGARIAEMSAYAVSKAGVLTLMRSIAQEERDTGVRSNALAPTAIRTAANLESMGEGARYVERDEVADAVEFLCFSPGSRSITGQTIQLG
ncbi:MAG TPA: SDR family NAD(P)-dependent oxidoreductase [Gemmatimonadaceae bacterium]|nr:SDR family NAD(P)-dependent oxidoreductase [Gemmatimonadaceae bacterium]